MMPPAAGFAGPESGEFIAFVERQVESGRKLSAAIADVAYIVMASNGYGRSSRSNVEVADRLRDALTDWFCAGPEEQVRKMKAGPKIYSFTPVASVEQLAGLVKQRDDLQRTLDQYADAAEKTANKPGGDLMATYMDVVTLPIRQQMEQLEARISEVQAQLEATADESGEIDPEHAGGQ